MRVKGYLGHNPYLVSFKLVIDNVIYIIYSFPEVINYIQYMLKLVKCKFLKLLAFTQFKMSF